MIIGVETTVDNLGRIVIPKKYRKFYDINPRENVYVVGTEDGLLISKGNYKVVEVKDIEKS